jgi:ribosomal protein S18 acetylase RimI-like enzyme
MSDPIIRLLADDDLDGALALSSTAGWNQRLDDWRMLLRLAPAGSFVALAEGRIVGTAIGISYGGFAWIAMMLVDPAHRGRGLGRRLLEAAMGAVPLDLPIRLDATPLGRPLYQRYGFEDEAILTRYASSAADTPRLGRARPSFTRRPGPRDGSSRVRRLTAGDLPSVTEVDLEVFGGRRGELLAWALANAPQYGLVVQSDVGVAQYCLGRQGRLFDQIGPVVAGDDEIAQELVDAALAAAGGRPVVVDAFDSHRTFGSSLRACGFQGQRPLFRMCRPSGRASSASMIGSPNRPPLSEFAILGPEFA